MENAARGTDGREYPWGDDWDPSKCHHDKEYSGNLQTCGVWSYAKGCSPWGHYQMGGNVSEWCEDWYNHDSYDRYRRGDFTPPTASWTTGKRVFRGGSCYDSKSFSFRCAYRDSRSPDHRYLINSFRVAWSVG